MIPRPSPDPQRSRRAITLTELLAVTGILAVLAAILIPATLSARSASRSVACASNLRQIGAAISQYVADNDSLFPPSSTSVYVQTQSSGDSAHYDSVANGRSWAELILPYVGQLFPRCPEARLTLDWENRRGTPVTSGYAYNANIDRDIALGNRHKTSAGDHEEVIKVPAMTITVFDARIGFLAKNEPDLPNDDDGDELRQQPPGATRHENGANYLFADGHAKWYPPGQLRYGGKAGDGIHPGFGL